MESERFNQFKYWAFLSYSHQDNLENRVSGAGGHIRWAEWLHNSLETYRVPAEFRARQTRTGEPMPERFFPVFQDEKELPITANLGESIRTALEQSRFLIVICSPRSATSRYVNEEVRYFKELGRQDRIMTLIIAGEPNVSVGNKPGIPSSEECFCPALRHPVDATGQVDVTRVDAQEPIAGDARIKDSGSIREPTVRDRTAHRAVLDYTKLKLLAGLMGVGFDELVQRDKERQIKEERARARRLRKLAAAFAFIGLIALIAAAIAWQQRNARARALAEVLRLSDAKKLHDLIRETDQLWPLSLDRAAAMKGWIDRARTILNSRGAHEQVLQQVKARISAHRDASRPGFSDAELDWQYSVLTDILGSFDQLEGKPGPGHGLLAEVTWRYQFVTSLAPNTIENPKAAWTETINAIKDEGRNPLYHGLVLGPQLGLIPLGRDPDSHLFEFAQIGTGSIPSRDSTSRLILAEETGIVFVLLPGGSFSMGAQRTDRNRLHFDPAAQMDESPVHTVNLSPFFISKYECTQAQWMTLSRSGNPSQYKAGQVVHGRTLTNRNPVEQVSWQECQMWASRYQLNLPTEAQWEYACRAGTDTPWSTGVQVARLSSVANIADAYLAAHGGPANWRFTMEVDDGYAVHTPVGSLAANRFGLHDMMGNVYEWCWDVYAPYSDAVQTDPTGPIQTPAAIRVGRGGSWSDAAEGARVSPRTRDAPGTRNDSLGVRFARSIKP